MVCHRCWVSHNVLQRHIIFVLVLGEPSEKIADTAVGISLGHIFRELSQSYNMTVSTTWLWWKTADSKD